MTTNDHEAGKVSDQRLAEIMQAGFRETDSHATAAEQVFMAAELRARRAESQTGAVRVKPLVWKGDDDEAYGEAGEFIYTVRRPNLTPGWRVWVSLHSGMGIFLTGKASSLKDAIAIAEADYEQRIRSAIE